MGLNDKLLDFAGNINNRIYYDHYGDTKNRSVSGKKSEVVVETTMATIAKLNGDDEAAKHQTERAVKSGVMIATK